MIFPALIFALMMLAIGGARAETSDTLSRAKAGLMQCYSPNVGRKTCKSLAAYRFRSDGQVDNPARTLVSPNPPTVMTTISTVSFRDGSICGFVRAEDVEHATIEVSGRSLNEAEAAPMKIQIKASLAPMIGREICTSYVANGNAYVTHVTINGTPQSQAQDEVIWIRPDAGYVVAP